MYKRLQYRWKYCADPLPGEIAPMGNVKILYYSEPEEQEKHVFLRRLRALLFGYGQAWTFWEAFKDWLI